MTIKAFVFLSVLELAGLRKVPEVVVVIIGRKNDVRMVLLHRTFRNTLHVIYFAVANPPSETTVPAFRIKMRPHTYGAFSPNPFNRLGVLFHYSTGT